MAYQEYCNARKVVVNRYICDETGIAAYEYEVFGCSPIIPLVYECGIPCFSVALKTARDAAARA